MNTEYKEIFSEIKNNLRDLQTQLDSARRQLNKLEGMVDFLERKVQDAQPVTPRQRESSSFESWKEFSAESTEPGRTINLQGYSGRIRRPTQYQSQQTTLQKPSAELSVVAEFNALSRQGGLHFKNSRTDFLRKYNVRAFNCVNFEARMNEPIPVPQFAEAATILSGEYWAVPLRDNSFAVFPNVRTYSDNYHTARAMGDVFDSNFTAGSTCNEIFVERPAIFDCSGEAWILKDKGNLRLG